MAKKKTKQQKAKEIEQLLRELDVGEPIDFSKVLIKQVELGDSEWMALLNVLVDDLLCLDPSRYLPAEWLEEALPLGSWARYDYERHILSGSVVVDALDRMKKQLGPNPRKAVILVDDDYSAPFCIVKEAEPSHKILDRCIGVLKEEVKEQDAEKKHAAEQEKKRTHEKLLLDAADKIGYEQALALLNGVEE